VPRRNENAGSRPRGPRDLHSLRLGLGLPSDGRRSVPSTNQADETLSSRAAGGGPGQSREPIRVREGTPTRPERAASTKYRDHSNGRYPVSDRLPQLRSAARTARVHAPAIDLGEDDVVYVAQGLVRVRRERLEQLR
jgi:hypothetical protein